VVANLVKMKYFKSDIANLARPDPGRKFSDIVLERVRSEYISQPDG
jgi:hypothetical protein